MFRFVLIRLMSWWGCADDNWKVCEKMRLCWWRFKCRFRFQSFRQISFHFVSFPLFSIRFLSLPILLFRFYSLLLVPCPVVSFRLVSFRGKSFPLVSFHFVLPRFFLYQFVFLVHSNIIFYTYSLYIEGAASSLTWVNSIKHSWSTRYASDKWYIRWIFYAS